MAEPLAEPENKFRTFYHGTYPDRIDSILRTGLDPSYVGGGGGTLPGLNEKDPRPKLFLTTSPSYAEFYAAMAAKTSAMAKAKEEGKGWIRQMLATGTPASPLRIDLPSDFKVHELAKGLGGHDEHYVTDLIPSRYIKAMNRLEKTSNDLTVLAPKWSERGHLLAALPKHLTDAQEAIKSQQNIDKEMTDLSLIAGAWLKSQQQKELLETRLKRFKETAGYPSMASVLPTPAVVGISNKEQAMNNLNKAAAFGAMMGKIAASAARPGLWANIRAKKQRGESTAKPGDKDYPDAKNWKKVTDISEKKAACWSGYERVPGTTALTKGSCRPVGKKKKESEKKAESPAWQRSEGKNPDGGLNNKGRASLKANGQNIKRPQPEGGPRKDSFCARMGGMKAKLTSDATANDPDSRINKALRKWNC